jgi:hypothetical protein
MFVADEDRDRMREQELEEFVETEQADGSAPVEMTEQRESAERAGTMEQALARTERDADAALKAADRVVKGLRQLKHAAEHGEVRRLRGSADALQQSIVALQQEVAHAAGSWNFDEESYMRDGRYARELLDRARAANLQMTEQDDRLYAYPMLITIDPARRAVLVDRKPERRIRPSIVVERLRARQQEPERFKPARFLEALYTGYGAARALAGRDEGAVIRLVAIYELLTMMPGASSEYSLAEFTRDVHLLDISGETTTKNGAVMTFDASTGTRSGRGVLSIVTRNGAEKRYYGVSFANPNRD